MRFSVLMALNYFVLIQGLIRIHTNFYLLEPYMVSFMYACLIFVIFMLLNNNLRIGKISQGLADMSYSVYLLHGVIGLYLLPHLTSLFNYELSLLFTLITVFLTCYIQFKLIEQPSQKLAKKLLAKN